MIDKNYQVVYDPEGIYDEGTVISGVELVQSYIECNNENYPILEDLNTFERLDIAVAFVAEAWGLVLE